MTTFLFRDDAYLTHCDAVVTAIDERGFQTDQTVFYPMRPWTISFTARYAIRMSVV